MFGANKVRSKHDFGGLDVNEERIICKNTDRKTYMKIYSNVRYWNTREPKWSGRKYKLVPVDGYLIVKRVR